MVRGPIGVSAADISADGQWRRWKSLGLHAGLMSLTVSIGSPTFYLSSPFELHDGPDTNSARTPRIMAPAAPIPAVSRTSPRSMHAVGTGARLRIAPCHAAKDQTGGIFVILFLAFFS